MTRGALVLAAAVLLGASSAALGANDNQSRNRGGFDIGPLGQCFDPPVCGGGRYRYGRYEYGRYGYDYVPRYYRRDWRYMR
jgi:hypothetical protein